ncbi:MAG: hypothetical protein NC078_09580, partial [Ruminococcus sp.]|nr:hypothetical protein [Ruminococcus sp.]
EITLPDSRLPYSENFSVASSDISFAAKRYCYGEGTTGEYYRCFLYRSNFDGLAAKVFAELPDGYGESYSLYPMQRWFGNFTDFEPINADSFGYLDEIYLCSCERDIMVVECSGLTVRSGEVIFGVCYDDGAVGEEEILEYLNGFFEQDYT